MLFQYDGYDGYGGGGYPPGTFYFAAPCFCQVLSGPPGYGGGGFGGGFGGPPGFGGPGYDVAQSPLDAEVQVVIREIHNELGLFDASGEYGEQFKNARRLLAAESDKLENNIDPEWLEVDIPKPIKVTKKVLIPNFRHPRFNFVGKILGPKGASLQAMAKQHKCHIYVLGRGSTKDRNKEQELLNSGDPQYAHYGGPLHVKVETIAPAHIAYQRVAGVLEELNRILQPIREDTTPGHLKEGENGTGNSGPTEGGDSKNGDGGEKQQNSFGGGGGRGGFGDRGRGGGRGAPRGGFRGRGGPGGPGRARGIRDSHDKIKKIKIKNNELKTLRATTSSGRALKLFFPNLKLRKNMLNRL
ncbi:hypothetical protein TELCIR_00592 [Teladorsagia circumcincta]|uniref:K Homology domain-containing protein n=1 Tax=Teladorsagia circumcincta TaxID=45464 RepID=A0A2G9V4F8_TELCI|nr:hypothetical protein TELCIR_00592 [Teladorsagia circumcincta]